MAVKNMSCEWIKTQICWYLFNELDDGERAALEEHVEVCQGCATELERERAFLSRLGSRPALEVSPGLLAECRYDLMRSIHRAERLRQAAAPGWWERLQQSLWPRWQPAGACFLLVAGFWGGWWTNSIRAGRGLEGDPTQLAIANISGVQLDPAAGEVKVSFDEMRGHTLSGRLEDPAIQKFLIYAASGYANPGVRMESIDILRQSAADREVRNALLHLVANDRNAGVRLKALESLKPFAPDQEVHQTLIRVLTKDDNPGMRVQAVDLLVQSQDRNLVGLLQGVVEKENNNYVRMRCRDALRAMNASLETF